MKNCTAEADVSNQQTETHKNRFLKKPMNLKDDRCFPSFCSSKLVWQNIQHIRNVELIKTCTFTFTANVGHLLFWRFYNLLKFISRVSPFWSASSGGDKRRIQRIFTLIKYLFICKLGSKSNPGKSFYFYFIFFFTVCTWLL